MLAAEQQDYKFFVATVGRVCIAPNSPKYSRFKRKEVDTSNYFNWYPYVDIYPSPSALRGAAIIR